jgi:hypothetical protein
MIKMGENEPEIIYRSVFKCSNCGAIVQEDATGCESCGAKLGEARSTRHPTYDEPTIEKMIFGVPNGEAQQYMRYHFDNGNYIDNHSGGVGKMVSNHEITLGPSETENPLTWRAIALALSLLAIEGYTPDVMLLSPYQMYDLMMPGYEDTFVGHNEGKTNGKPGVIGFMAGMEVVVSKHMPAGKVLIFNSEHYDPTEKEMNGDAAVLLFGGGTSIGGGGQW